MKAKVQALLKQDFVKHNLVFLIGSLGIAAFNYLYYPIVGRLVPVADFGEVQAWISLFMEFGIILTAFGYIITNIVHNHDEKPSKTVLLVELERLAMVVSIVLFLGLWAASFYLKSSLQFTSALPFIALGALIILNVPATLRTYFLQGEKKLKNVAMGGIVFAAGKLVLSVIFILIGFKILGVVLGYILAQAANLYYVAYKTKGHLPSVRSAVPVRLEGLKFQSERKDLKREAVYGIFILILLAIVTILYTSDAIIVRRYFTVEQAGFFSGISSVARIVFFVTASVAGVLIASVKIKSPLAENRRTLTKSLLLVVGLGGIVFLGFLVLPKLAVSILIGHKYQAYSYLLPWLSISMLIGAVNNLLFSYQIALRKFKTLIPAVLGIALLAVTVVMNHSQLKAIAYDYIACNLLIFLITFVQIYATQRSQRA
jgi:O-antigen/teichoic acid export membrane protein